jgi:spore coat protein U-like protein
MTSALTATPLAYDLYMDPSRTLRWGGAPTEAIIVSGSGMNTPVARSVYGRVEAPDAEAADPANNYQDAVTLSVTW